MAASLESCLHCQTALMSPARFCHRCGAPADAAWLNTETDPNFLSELFQLTRGLTSTVDLDSLLKKLGQAAENMLQAEASSVMLLEPDKKNLYFKVATGEKGGVVGRCKIKVGEGVAGWVVEQKQPVLANDVSADRRFSATYDAASGFKTRSVLCVPVIAGDELVGVMEVLNKKSPTGFTAVDQGVLENLGRLAALAILNAHTVAGLRNFYVHALEILIAGIETRDMRMAGHCWRVAERSSLLGRRLGLEGTILKDLYYAALLHDIGFLKVAGGLSRNRVLVMESPHQEQTHPLIGVEMIRDIQILKGAAELIAFHHECYDGSGFPRGLKGDQIPLGGHILSIIEACEELRMSGYSEEQILASLEEQSGRRFHPDVAKAYHEILEQSEKRVA